MLYKIMKNFLFVLLLTNFSCSKKKQIDQAPEEGIRTIKILGSSEVNEKFALKIEIVQVFSKEMMQSLVAMDATTFKQKKEEILLNYPEELTVWEIDIMNHEKSRCYVVPESKDYWGIIIFFHFFENSKNKLVYPASKDHITLQISQGSFILKEEELNDKFCYILSKKSLEDEYEEDETEQNNQKNGKRINGKK